MAKITKWKIREYSWLGKEARFLQERDFHLSRLRSLMLMTSLDPFQLRIVKESLEWIDTKNGHRPVKGWDSLRKLIGP